MEDKQADLQIVPVADPDDDEALPPGISVAKFDYSVANHFKAMEKMFKLSGESEFEYDQSEIQRLSSSVSFLREWRYFCYQPRAIRFSSGSKSPHRKDVIGGINLPQFSSAAVPKDISDGNTVPSHLSKDFVMHVGGLVWTLDWCPRVHQKPDCDINVEFIAVAAHPPESSYHKIGAPLTGRGVIQIWGLLNVAVKDQDATTRVKQKLKKNSRSNEATQSKRPRGRPRKNPEGSSKMDGIYLETPEKISEKDTCRDQDPPGRVSTQQQHTRSTETIKFISLKPDKQKGSVRKKRTKDSADFQTSNQHVQPLSVEFPDGSCNSSRPERPKGSPINRRLKESVGNIGGNNQYLKSLAVKFPEDSLKLLAVDEIPLETPEIVSEEDNGSNSRDLGAGASQEDQQQNPKGSDEKVLKLSEPHKPRRHRTKPTHEAVNDSICNIQHVQTLGVQLTECSNEMLPEDDSPSKAHELVTEKDYNRKRKGIDKGYSEKLVLTASKSRLTKCKLRPKGQVNGTDLPLLSQKCGTSLLNSDASSGCGQDPLPLLTDSDSCSISEDVALPRLIMCLAHNGKVAWDVKWRPYDSCANSKHRMGYLAVLLGNGALEVWEVPHPLATEVIFSACQKKGTDPRFIKLEPVFRCSMLKCGDRQSIPQTVEWSTSSPYDLILAGCHDGVVALWKFSANGPLKDTRPLLCFSADTVPIRALAWAPVVRDPESANIIVTAGHKGVKFWDIRDPFRPLWDVNPVQRIIYSLDWLPDPRCVVLSFDDGEIRIISLVKAACDVPVTGSPFVATQLQGLHSYHCSSSSIWSVQVSRLTGMVAYCCSDGTVLCFQLTTKAVEKDPRRNREPHYLCGSLTMEGSALTVFSPLPDTPFPMKKSSNDWGHTPISRRGFLAIANQEKRAKEQMVKCRTPEEQSLALCYGNDSGSDSDTLTAKTPKTSTCIDEVPNVNKFPPKIVAMHRVRWNMNKGSERWLCYGGAAGILRCQEIIN